MFSKIAPAYWAAGIPVIPLKPREKAPAINAWSKYSAEMPSEETQAEWLAAYPDGNIGLPLGPVSGCVALDLDTDDPAVLRVLDKVLPPSPWKRVGKKGFVKMYKYSGERTCRIKDAEGKTLVELLSKSVQVVLPPSIHPDTQRPYEANCELLSVIGNLPSLPLNFEVLLRQALIDEGVKLGSRSSFKIAEWVPAGGRDSMMTSMAGLLAMSVVRKEKSLLEAMNEAEAWIMNFAERVSGDDLDPSKGSQKVIEFVRRDVLENGKSLGPNWSSGLSPEDTVRFKEFFGEVVEDWTTSEYLNHLESEFISVPGTDQGGRATIMDGVMVRMSKQNVDAMQEEIILQYMHNANSKLMTMGALRKRMRDLRKPIAIGEDHTEVAQMLLRELEKYGEVCFANGQFWQWVGSHWNLKIEGEIIKVLVENFGSLPAAKRSSDHYGIVRTLRNIVPQGLKRINVEGINFANGYLTMDRQLENHDPKFGCTYVLPYRYAPNEGAPLRFLSLLDQCWGQDADYSEKVLALQEAMASTLFGMGPRFSRAVLLYGLPRTGKSTIKDIMRGMIPDDACSTVPPDEWGDRFAPTSMLGKLLNFAGELSETSMIAGDKFKMIVEGEEMRGEFKGGQIFKFRPLATHWFASNHLPRTRDTSSGFNRRWLILHFQYPVSDQDKVLKLAELILAEEREAIAAWAIAAIEDLMRRSEYTLPQSHKDRLGEMAATNNSVRSFMQSGMVAVVPVADGQTPHHISEEALYNRYWAFCKLQTNAPPVSLLRFKSIAQEMQRELGFRIVKETEGLQETHVFENLIFVEHKRVGSK